MRCGDHTLLLYTNSCTLIMLTIMRLYGHGQQVHCLTTGFIKKMRDLPVQQAAEGHAQKSA